MIDLLPQSSILNPGGEGLGRRGALKKSQILEYILTFHCLIDKKDQTALTQENLTDQKLITAARRGDHEAFKELVRRYETRVAATVIGMLGKCPEAEDVGQETFIRFYKSLEKFRGESSLGTYLTRIAMNLSLNELRRRKRRAIIFFHKPLEEVYDVPDAKASHQAADDKELVHQAIQKLEQKFRSVIVLRLIDGYSTEETARILNVPVGTVLSRLARAQKKLKELLKPYYGDER
jgi:RNA polymerase sigma-70 factor (ECF subfamily)